MNLDLSVGGVSIGRVRRSGSIVYAWAPDGSPIGQFHDLDAAARGLARRAGLGEHAT